MYDTDAYDIDRTVPRALFCLLVPSQDWIAHGARPTGAENARLRSYDDLRTAIDRMGVAAGWDTYTLYSGVWENSGGIYRLVVDWSSASWIVNRSRLGKRTIQDRYALVSSPVSGGYGQWVIQPNWHGTGLPLQPDLSVVDIVGVLEELLRQD